MSAKNVPDHNAREDQQSYASTYKHDDQAGVFGNPLVLLDTGSIPDDQEDKNYPRDVPDQSSVNYRRHVSFFPLRLQKLRRPKASGAISSDSYQVQESPAFALQFHASVVVSHLAGDSG